MKLTNLLFAGLLCASVYGAEIAELRHGGPRCKVVPDGSLSW